jgi:hypothetical protein
MKPGHRIEKTKGQRHRSPQTHSKKRKHKASVASELKAVEDLRQAFDEPYRHLRHLAKRSDKNRLAWHRRPRIDLSGPYDAEREAKLLEIFGSDRRLELFRTMAADYEKLPSLENYPRLRTSFSEAELSVAVFNELENLLALQFELERLAIPLDLVAGALKAYEPDIDQLSLRLMECLVARDKLPRGGQGHIERRRQAISDALVDYLIVTMLEATEKSSMVIPSSLIVLIRDRLCGPNPDWARSSRSMEWEIILAQFAAQRLPSSSH